MVVSGQTKLPPARYCVSKGSHYQLSREQIRLTVTFFKNSNLQWTPAQDVPSWSCYPCIQQLPRDFLHWIDPVDLYTSRSTTFCFEPSHYYQLMPPICCAKGNCDYSLCSPRRCIIFLLHPCHDVFCGFCDICSLLEKEISLFHTAWTEVIVGSHSPRWLTNKLENRVG